MTKPDVSKVAAFHFPLGDPEIDRLMSPGRYFQAPDEVLADATLTTSEKRAILASWASDACSVEAMPALRRWPGAREAVSFDDVMAALQRLDAIDKWRGTWTRRGGGNRSQGSPTPCNA